MVTGAGEGGPWGRDKGRFSAPPKKRKLVHISGCDAGRLPVLVWCDAHVPVRAEPRPRDLLIVIVAAVVNSHHGRRRGRRPSRDLSRLLLKLCDSQAVSRHGHCS